MICRHLFIFFAFLSLTIMGCTSTPVDETYEPLPELTFAHLVEIPLQIRDIDFISETRRGAQPWDIAGSLVTPPDIAMRRYLQHRFDAKGSQGVLTLELAKADIFYNEIPNENPLLDSFALANRDEYSFEIIVNLSANYISGHPDRETSLRFFRKVVMDQGVSPTFRDAKLQRVLEEIISDIDGALISEFAHNFNILNERDRPFHNIAPLTAEPIKSERKILIFPKAGDEKNEQSKEL
jgi:hypothetical protein